MDAGIKARYDEYVDCYRNSEGKLPEMMQLKYVHTMMVVKNAKLIADGEGFTEEERASALVAALLHDTGRYEQLRRYNTFRDSESVDHAVFSHAIVRDRGWLDGGGYAREAILDAILYHNRRDLPAGMDALTSVVARTVRDADKLDIFRVLENEIIINNSTPDSRAFWNLKVGLPPSVEIVNAIREGRPADYQHIRTLADFVLIQVGWMINGLEFATARRLCRERGHLEFRRKFLRKIGGGEAAEAICEMAAQAKHER